MKSLIAIIALNFVFSSYASESLDSSCEVKIKSIGSYSSKGVMADYNGPYNEEAYGRIELGLIKKGYNVSSNALKTASIHVWLVDGNINECKLYLKFKKSDQSYLSKETLESRSFSLNGFDCNFDEIVEKIPECK